jgi:uncharacterized protein YPO0396
VNDFHTVDYEALSTLNISATQALVKRLNKAENALKVQAEQLETQAARLTNLEKYLAKEMTENKLK